MTMAEVEATALELGDRVAWWSVGPLLPVETRNWPASRTAYWPTMPQDRVDKRALVSEVIRCRIVPGWFSRVYYR